MGYSDWIRRARHSLTLTQRELGERIGATDGYISHIEQGLRVPSPEMATALARELELSPDDQRRFLETIDAARLQRSRRRLDKRREALRGALARHRESAEAPAPEDDAPEPLSPLDQSELERELSRDPRLASTWRDLMAAYADPDLRDAVVKTLRGLAASSRAARNGAPAAADPSSSNQLDE